MNLTIPKTFVSVNQEQFERALATANYTRTCWYDGDEYLARSQRIAVRSYSVDRAGYYLCPEYFTPS